MTALTLQKIKTDRYSSLSKYLSFALLLISLMALFPPLYLSLSNSTAIYVGLPVQIIYWVSIPVLAGICLWGFYLIESHYGIINSDEDK